MDKETVLRLFPGAQINERKFESLTPHIFFLSAERFDYLSEDKITLDADFTRPQIEAILYWIKNKEEFK